MLRFLWYYNTGDSLPLSDATGSGGEKYEKSEAEKRDQVFHKFMKRISACQEQILR